MAEDSSGKSNTAAQKIARVCAYFLGISLLFFGIIGLGIEIELGKATSHGLFGYSLGIIFIVCGALSCIATRLHYGGGLWSVIGITLMGFATPGMISFYNEFTHHTKAMVFDRFYLRLIAYLMGGCFCLIMGELRRRKIKRASQNLDSAK